MRDSELYDVSEHILNNKKEILEEIRKYEIDNPLKDLDPEEHEEAYYDELVYYLIYKAKFQFDLIVFYLTKDHVRKLLGTEWYIT